MTAPEPSGPPLPGLKFGLVPWDSAACGFPVGQITSVPPGEPAGWSEYEAWRDREALRMVSCRIGSGRLREGQWLESKGFRFIEMVLQPVFDLANATEACDPGLRVTIATLDDVPAIARIAETAFVTDRFTVDPRLPRGISGIRYRRWVEATPAHPTQRLHRVDADGSLAAFFITELHSDGTCQWHLTAVDPALHGRGLGRRIWQTMLGCARIDGALRISTVISALNTPVINLYAGLGFRFQAPGTTYHWIRD
jgi:GNAT superfamily N-acetyltransferase